MTINKCLLTFFFILILIIIFNYYYKIVENFKTEYISEPTGAYNFLSDKPSELYPYSNKEMTITLKNNLLYPLNIILDENSLGSLYFKKKLMNIFPFKHKILNSNFEKAIQYTNKNKNSVLLINEDNYANSFLGINNYKVLPNNRFIGSLFNSSITLITTLQSDIQSWSNLLNKSIVTIENSEDLINLTQILSIIGYKKKDIEIFTVSKIDYLLNIFNNSNVDAIYLTTHHPNKIIQQISNNVKIRIIFKEGIPDTKFKFFFPFAFHENVDLRNYNLYPNKNPLVKTYSIRKIMVTNKDTDQKDIYNFIKSIFQNIQYIKGSHEYLSDFTPSYISLCSPLLRYHKGAMQFYIENNYISYKFSELCYLYTGGYECKQNQINKSRFITDFSKINNYNSNYTILNSKGEWNNVVNDWTGNSDFINLKKNQIYINIPSEPLLLSHIIDTSTDTPTDRSIVLKNHINQIQNSSTQLFPNL